MVRRTHRQPGRRSMERELSAARARIEHLPRLSGILRCRIPGRVASVPRCSAVVVPVVPIVPTTLGAPG
jgi:hypothetical protein